MRSLKVVEIGSPERDEPLVEIHEGAVLEATCELRASRYDRSLQAE